MGCVTPHLHLLSAPMSKQASGLSVPDGRWWWPAAFSDGRSPVGVFSEIVAIFVILDAYSDFLVGLSRMLENDVNCSLVDA